MLRMHSRLREAIEKGANGRCYAVCGRAGVRFSRFADLKKQADSVAAWLLAHTPPGARVAFSLPAGLPRLAVFFGAAAAGCTVVPLDPAAGEDALAPALREANPDLLFFSNETAALFYDSARYGLESSRFVYVGKKQIPGAASYASFPPAGQSAAGDRPPDCAFLFFPEDGGFAARLTAEDLLAAADCLIPPGGERCLLAEPPDSPYYWAAVIALTAGRAEWTDAAPGRFRKTASAFRPGYIYTSPAGCAAMLRALYAAPEVQEGADSPRSVALARYGDAFWVLRAVGGGLARVWTERFDSVGVTLIQSPSFDGIPAMQPFLRAACPSPAPRLPENDAERRVLEAVRTVFGKENADLNDSVLRYSDDPVRISAFALSLHMLPVAVYDSPFLFSVASRLENETFQTHTPDPAAVAALRAPAEKAVLPEGDGVFITGASGFFGMHLARAVAAAGKKAYCLVRNKDRFLARYTAYFGLKTAARIRPVEGDVTRPYFGMPLADARKYNGKLFAVVHAAAKTEKIGAYRDFADVNVNGAYHAARFSRAAGCPLWLISDLRIFDFAPENAAAGERDLFIGQRYYVSPYAQSKIGAEQQALLARTAGTAANIVRLGELLPSLSSRAPRPDGRDTPFVSGLNALVRLGAQCPALDPPRCRIPVDEAARATLFLIQTGARGRVFHLPGAALRYADALRMAGVSLPVASPEAFFTLLRENAKDPAAHEMLENLYLPACGEQAAVTAEETAAFLGDGFAQAQPESAYFASLLRDPPRGGNSAPAEDALSPAALHELRRRLRAPSPGVLFLRETATAAAAEKYVWYRQSVRPVYAAGETDPFAARFAALFPHGTVLTPAETETPEGIRSALDKLRADALFVRAEEGLLEKVRRAAPQLPFAVVASPLGVPAAPGAGAEAVLCGADAAEGASPRELRRQTLLILTAGLEVCLSPLFREFGTETAWGAEAVQTVLSLADAVGNGALTPDGVAALQTACVRAGMAYGRVGGGWATAFARAARRRNGTDSAAVYAAVMPALLRAQETLCAPALAALAESCFPQHKKNAAALLSALVSAYEKTGGDLASALPGVPDPSAFAMDVYEEAWRLICPADPFGGDPAGFISRIFPGI